MFHLSEKSLQGSESKNRQCKGPEVERLPDLRFRKHTAIEEAQHGGRKEAGREKPSQGGCRAITRPRLYQKNMVPCLVLRFCKYNKQSD